MLYCMFDPMDKSGFRKPEEFLEKDETTHVSGRIKASAKEILEKAAAKNKKSLSWLVGRVLEDYAEWLSQQQSK